MGATPESMSHHICKVKMYLMQKFYHIFISILKSFVLLNIARGERAVPGLSLTSAIE